MLGSAVRGARIVTPRLALFCILWPTQRLSLFSHHGSRLAPSPLFWTLLVPLMPLSHSRSFTSVLPHAQVCPAAPRSLSRWSALVVSFYGNLNSEDARGCAEAAQARAHHAPHTVG